ncbi:MAG: hypothetical protein ACKV0T_21305 [Planctomycetales bacterium]
MHTAMPTYRGILRGRTIELDQAPGLPEGQSVNVTVEPTNPSAPSTRVDALEALRRAAGSWSDDEDDLDRYLEWNRRQRQGNRPEIPE